MRETLKNSLRKNEDVIFDYSKIPASNAVLSNVELPVDKVRDKRGGKLIGVLVSTVLISVLGLSLLIPDVQAFVSTIIKKKESTATLSIEYADFVCFDSVNTGRVDSISYKNNDHIILYYFEPITNGQSLFFDDTLKTDFIKNEVLSLSIQYLADPTGCIAKFEYKEMLHTIFSDMPEGDFREMLQSMQLQE